MTTAQTVEDALIEAWLGGVRDDLFEEKSWPNEATIVCSAYHHLRIALEKRSPNFQIWADCKLPEEMWQGIGFQDKCDLRYDLIISSWNRKPGEWENVRQMPADFITIHSLIEVKYVSFTSSGRELIVEDLDKLFFWENIIPGRYLLYIPVGAISRPAKPLIKNVKRYKIPILIGNQDKRELWGICTPQKLGLLQ